MTKYTSGTGILEMELVQTDERKHYNFKVTIEGNEHYSFVGTQYSCPRDWSEEMIASDMFGWAVDACCDGDDDIKEAVEYEEVTVNHQAEDVIKVQPVIN